MHSFSLCCNRFFFSSFFLTKRTLFFVQRRVEYYAHVGLKTDCLDCDLEKHVSVCRCFNLFYFVVLVIIIDNIAMCISSIVFSFI